MLDDQRHTGHVVKIAIEHWIRSIRTAQLVPPDEGEHEREAAARNDTATAVHEPFCGGAGAIRAADPQEDD